MALNKIKLIVNVEWHVSTLPENANRPTEFEASEVSFDRGSVWLRMSDGSLKTFEEQEAKKISIAPMITAIEATNITMVSYHRLVPVHPAHDDFLKPVGIWKDDQNMLRTIPLSHGD